MASLRKLATPVTLVAVWMIIFTIATGFYVFNHQIKIEQVINSNTQKEIPILTLQIKNDSLKTMMDGPTKNHN